MDLTTYTGLQAAIETESKWNPRHTGHKFRSDAKMEAFPFKPLMLSHHPEGKHGPTMARFFRRVVRTTQCWNWSSMCSVDGYGRFQIGGKRSPTRNAHRFLYETLFGKVKDGNVVRHKCDNPKCVNPFHLEQGTQAQNIQDKMEKGRQAFGQKHGRSKITEQQALDIKYGKDTSYDAASKHGISKDMVNRIRSGKNWSHI